VRDRTVAYLSHLWPTYCMSQETYIEWCDLQHFVTVCFILFHFEAFLHWLQNADCIIHCVFVAGCIYLFQYAYGQYPIQSNVNKRAQVFLFARIFYNITFTYKLKHLRFQLTRVNTLSKEHSDVNQELSLPSLGLITTSPV